MSAARIPGLTVTSTAEDAPLSAAQLAFLDFCAWDYDPARASDPARATEGYIPALWTRYTRGFLPHLAETGLALGYEEASLAVVELLLACDALEAGRTPDDDDLQPVVGNSEANRVVPSSRHLSGDRGGVNGDPCLRRDAVDADGAAGRDDQRDHRPGGEDGNADAHLQRLARVVVAKRAAFAGRGEVGAEPIGPFHGRRSSSVVAEGDDRGREGWQPPPAPAAYGWLMHLARRIVVLMGRARP